MAADLLLKHVMSDGQETELPPFALFGILLSKISEWDNIDWCNDNETVLSAAPIEIRWSRISSGVRCSFILSMLLKSGVSRLLLALIYFKISHCCRDEPDVAPQVDEKVASVYSGVAIILQRYTTGGLSKAFNIMPSLTNWEVCIHLHWTALCNISTSVLKYSSKTKLWIVGQMTAWNLPGLRLYTLTNLQENDWCCLKVCLLGQIFFFWKEWVHDWQEAVSAP